MRSNGPVSVGRIIATDEACARRKAEMLRIVSRRLQRFIGNVGADSGRVRQFGQQREQDRAGAGAEIGDARPRDSPDPLRSISSASSTTVSVSGRGTSVAGDSASGSPQNSFCPRMRATGSPASRRRARASRRADSSDVSNRFAAEIMPVRSRPSAWPTSSRASSSAESTPADCRRAASARRAASIACPANAAALTPPHPAPPIARPGAPWSARRPVRPALRRKSPAAACRASG